MKVKDLREIAKSSGLRGYSRLRKSELISLIMSEEERRKNDEIERRRQERLEKATAEAKAKAEKKAKSKARRQAKREEAKLEAEHRAEVKRVESNQRRQRAENITGERPSGKETKSQREQRQRLERQAKRTETQRKAHEQAQRKNPKKARKEAKRRHRATKKEKRREQERLRRQTRPELLSTALEENVQRWFISGAGYKIPDAFLNDKENDVREIVDKVNGSKKVYTVLKCELIKHNLKTGEKMYTEFHGRSKTHTITIPLGDTYEEMKGKMLESLAKFQKEGSGWQLHSITGLNIVIVKFNPLSGSGYSKLPPFIAKKKAVINMKNKDDQCFKWAVTRALNPVNKDSDRITKELKNQAKKLNWDGITFPVKVKDIHIWEKNNDKLVNIFGYDEDTQKIYIVRMSDGCFSTTLEENKDKFISLFLHDDNHYCVVKSLGRLIGFQLSKKKNKKHFCLNCMNGFGTEKVLKSHQEFCLNRRPQTEVFPNPGETTKFKNYERLHDIPFTVYADFECFVKPLETEDKDPKKSYTVQYQNHIPSGFCYTIKCMEPSLYPTKTVLKTATYEGENMGKSFVETLGEDLKPIYKILKNPRPISMTDSDKSKHKNSKACYACRDEFGTTRTNEKTNKKEKVVKCQDHCHITGKYRGAACDKCNLRMKTPMFVPVVFHNLEGYDAHLFVKSLGLEEGDIRCIPKTDEKYISFSKNIPMETIVSNEGKEKTLSLEMRFIDSLKFTLKSLDSLTKTLGEDQFETLTSQMSVDPKSLNLLKRKGVFPYEYMTDFSKLNATSLPPKEAFYSQLTDSEISDDDYDHAQKVWDAFHCKTMKDYHNLYLKTDVLLLADVMTEFRKTCKKAYGLEAFHYYTSPGLAWDAMLKFTKVELDLLSNADMYLMVEKGIRGGVSSIMKRYSRANHKGLDDYDPKRPNKHILYLDANNLYGWAMSKPLPHKNFKWMNANELKDWRSKPCILEVDLEYPKELHDLHNEYPLAPERLLVGKVEKLIPNLNDKKKYVLHHENLKLYLKMGLKLTKIHRGITFEESCFMRSYINLNTNIERLL